MPQAVMAATEAGASHSHTSRLPDGGEGCALRAVKFEHGNGADSCGLACVLGEARVAPRLLGVDAVAFSAGQFADGHLICLGSAFDSAAAGGGQVVVPVRVGGCSG